MKTKQEIKDFIKIGNYNANTISKILNYLDDNNVLSDEVYVFSNS